eukprot:TRINITY_DN48318_c0_g1_i1.p1 TRINITY_DN48318_c0_g1~~TRINITY_DN48318_c0_g1_i1.p1  ORF type:complete len:514 (+),score=83.25 TRINITY_DN48318_c0_g1_i1:150-1691(+)
MSVKSPESKTPETATPESSTGSRTDEASSSSTASRPTPRTSGAGKVGLRNLGNTCFMSAGLQCLSHLEPLAFFFLSGEFREQINRSGTQGSAGELATAFAELQRALWQSGSPMQDPSDLHALLTRQAPYLFEGKEQQDVHEFLAFCLDGLHEDLNLASARPSAKAAAAAQEELDEDTITRTHGEEFGAAFAWLKHLERNKSFLVDFLQGQLRSMLTCKRCGNTSRRFDPFLYLSLPVTRTMSTVTDALAKYLEEECLQADERWHCEKCKQRVDAKKKIDLWKLPPVLILHLKRFEYDNATGEFRKIATPLEAPLTLDLAPYCSSPQREGALYEVVCVANHIGTYGAGHYTATCRVSGSRKVLRRGDSAPPVSEWHYFDDERVSPLDPQASVVGEDAYVIFLSRCNQQASDASAVEPCSPVRQSVASPQFWPHQVSKTNSAIQDILPGRVGSGAAVACVNPRSHMLVASSPTSGMNPRSATMGGYGGGSRPAVGYGPLGKFRSSMLPEDEIGLA